MSSHVVLTYAYLRSLKPAPKRKRYFVNDALVPGLIADLLDTRVEVRIGNLGLGVVHHQPAILL